MDIVTSAAGPPNSLTSARTALADTETNPFARSINVAFTGTAWTKSISNGEMVRTNTDQTILRSVLPLPGCQSIPRLVTTTLCPGGLAS
jgi:hypothetical protein